MNKIELMKYEKYFIAPKIILDIFKDEDEIPIEIIELMIYRDEPKEYIWRLPPTVYNYVKEQIKQTYELENIHRKSSFTGKNNP